MDDQFGPRRTGKAQRSTMRVTVGQLDPTWSLMSQAHRVFPVEVRKVGSLDGALRESAR